jgi:hypothetical protein
MLQYIRAFVPGGTFFFTVTLLERCGKLMMLKAGCAAGRASVPASDKRPGTAALPTPAIFHLSLYL